MSSIPAILGACAALFNYFSDNIARGIRFRYLINLLFAVLILAGTLLGIRLGINQSGLSIWQVNGWPASKIGLVFDFPGWIFAVALSSALLMSITAIQDGPAENKAHRASVCFMMGAAGLLGVLAVNPLTLIIAWALIDLVQFGYIFFFGTDPSRLGGLLLTLAYRLFGILALFFSMLYFPQTDSAGGFELLGSSQTILILMAALLRLGILPPYEQLEKAQTQLPRPIRASFSIVPAAAGLILLARSTAGELSSAWMYGFLLLALFAALYAAFIWLANPIQLQWRTFWILGFSALALASAVLAEAEAAGAWAGVAIYGGVYLYFGLRRSRATRFLFGAIPLVFIGLPFTLSWSGTNLFGHIGILLPVLFIGPLSMLVFGWVRSSFQPEEDEISNQMGNDLIANIVAILLIAFYFIIGIWMGINGNGFSSGNFWTGFLVLVLGVGLIVFNNHFSITLPGSVTAIFRRTASMDWLGRFAWVLYRHSARYINLLSSLLEGESGTLWSLLALMILLSLTISVLN
ncbi:MAG: hypothetical protein ACK2UW_02005 [Anaerolineales bacterium]